MSESLNKESSGDREPVPCSRCHKPFAKELKFTVSSWFQTDPGDGLSRWQDCCKCGIEEENVDDDLPFSQSLSGSHILKLPVSGNSDDDDGWKYPSAGQETSWTTASYDTPVEFLDGSISETEAPVVDDLRHENQSPDDDHTDIMKGVSAREPIDSEPTPSATTNVDLAGEPIEAEAAEDKQDSQSPNVHPTTLAVDESAPGEAAQNAPDLPATKEAASEVCIAATVESPGEKASTSSSTKLGDKSEENLEKVQPISDMGTKYDGNFVPQPAKPSAVPKPLNEVVVRHSSSTGVQSSVTGENQTYMIGSRYEVDSVIGKGTLGPTYKARDVATGKLLCLKMVSTPISRHRRIVKRILQEVEKAKTLNHPQIVAIYDLAIDKSGRPFYVMDLFEQGSLKQAIKQEGFLDVPEVLDIFLDVCEALTYAHEHGVLHRDLKPSNILLTGAESARRAKVGDFGIIKALPSIGSEALEMTQSTDVFADPSCMSPEQCLGRRLDVRSDIYSLGCSMYEAIIGKRLFTGPNPLSVVVQHFKAAPRSFDSVMYNCDIHEDVEAVVMRMLEKSPENRYQEISQVIEDLKLLKAHKKPNHAYQKRKANRSLNPFGGKEEPNGADKMFELVLNNKNAWNDKESWGDEQKNQIAADIERMAKRPQDNERRQRMRVVHDGHNTDDVIAEIRIQEIKKAPLIAPASRTAAADEVWMRGKKVQLPAKIDAPDRKVESDYAENRKKQSPVEISEPPMSNSQAEIQAVKLTPRQLAEMQEKARMLQQRQEALQKDEQAGRALMPMQKHREPEHSSVTLFTDIDEDEDDMPLVTVEQAKRQIPDYLLQISQPPGSIFTSPAFLFLVVASFISVVLIYIILVAGRPY